MVVVPTPLIMAVDIPKLATNQLELSKPTGKPEEADAVSGRERVLKVTEEIGEKSIVCVPFAMTKLLVWVATPYALDAVRMVLFVPALVGVPLISPLVAIERPDGRLDPANVIGAVPLAVTVLLNTTPTVPLKELVEVKRGRI